MAIGIRISLRGIQETVARIQALMALGQADGKSRTELHRRYGRQAMNWINENFRSGGGLLEDGPWQPLSENTVAGRIKRSNAILRDRGNLQASFQPQVTSTEVRIGSPLKVALFHEKGTAGPYPIVPRNKKALAFAVSARFARFARTTSFNTATGTSRTVLRAGRVSRRIAQQSARFGTGHLKTGMNVVLARGVMHPGLVARRMLPRESELLPRLLVTTENWLAGVGVQGATTERE